MQPYCWQRVWVNRVVKPRPGARAKGRLDTSPDTMLPAAAMRQVAVMTSSKSMPAPESRPGMTRIRYTMEQKVVHPPRISPPRVAPRWERRKNRSSCFISPHLLYCGKDVHSYEQDGQDVGDGGIFFPFPLTRLMAV